MIIRIIIYSIYTAVITGATTSNYNIYWSSEPRKWENDLQNSKQIIYCYGGTDKTLLSLWQTVKFKVKVKDDDFCQYLGETPDEVYEKYKEDKNSWSPFRRKPYSSTSINPFETKCISINTKHKHGIELQIRRVDLWQVLQTCVGVVLILLSESLCGNPLFFYLCGILIGVVASLLIGVYYVSSLLPKKTFTYSVLIGGWTVGVFIFQQIWENIQSVMVSYHTYVVWYVAVASFVSFVVCYRVGPPNNQRSKNLVMWTLQAVGVLLVFLSSWFQEASMAIGIMALVVKYMPTSFLNWLAGFWRMRFPPKRRYLTNEEYYEQGARETKLGLENLRKYCASPDCAQWRIMLKLHDTKRFASFVEGDSHLSDEEILNYESYAFSPNRQKKQARIMADEVELTDLEISDDDSSQSED